MKIVKTPIQLRALLEQEPYKQGKIGFVPTMGALHQGHISLIEESQKMSDFTVCSIFVNPTQFNDPEDLKKYPRPIEQDIKMLETAHCDVLYLPSESDIYPEKIQIKETFYVDGLDTVLEGASRPGHFSGVMQVVKILLEHVQPDLLFLGQKDYQQFLILSKMVQLLHLKTEVVRCNIYREKSGLAMSSRNIRLSADARMKAGLIYATLKYAASLLPLFNIFEIKQLCFHLLNAPQNFHADYFEILDAKTLKEISDSTTEYIIITSVIVEGVRLIDNILIKMNG